MCETRKTYKLNSFSFDVGNLTSKLLEANVRKQQTLLANCILKSFLEQMQISWELDVGEDWLLMACIMFEGLIQMGVFTE